ncbi:MAG TPA: hypothetical protein VEL28_21485 [Candidatus Binatia bacterium]|nr:hypothetical protein [Candidatus Binatia bacterium]
MRGRISAFVIALMLSGCAARISGVVTDASTKEVIGPNCAVTLGHGVRRTDFNGRYVINKDNHYDAPWLRFRAPGYEPLDLPVDWGKGYRQRIDVEMTPKAGRLSSEELAESMP